ncbi:Ctr copper transporter, partial [Flammula alnicola]
MIPYLHFTGGDFLYFRAWHPTSGGAIAGACIGLVMLALFERWLGAARRALDTHWRRSQAKESNDKALFVQTGVQEISREESSNLVDPNLLEAPECKTVAMKSLLRTVMPFIPAHDLPRGILYALQMFIMYLLMLAVMTFQAAFLISVVLGLGIGEIIFGRIG